MFLRLEKYFFSMFYLLLKASTNLRSFKFGNLYFPSEMKIEFLCILSIHFHIEVKRIFKEEIANKRCQELLRS